jgi:tetratricopeptide (TPR) repeat protein
MLKINSLKYIFCSFLLVLIIACSTKKNNLVNRTWHNKNTKYNTLYNGGLALTTGTNELKTGYNDDFWEVLPIERMQVVDELMLPGQKEKNKNFERAETKATKAIQKHSMNIEGREKNPQMDEAHLLLGKARYYDQRFIPALEAFNYILYKYPNSDKIYEAKVWREKTNLRLENDALAVKNLKRLIKGNQLKPQVLADANATLSQAYLNLEQKDSAVAPLKMALAKTKIKEEKARYHFILGQLYQRLSYNDSAYAEFQQIIEMKRKSPRRYVIQAHAQQAQLFDPTKDTVVFLEKYAKLLKDRENRPFLDVLNYQVGSFYDKQKNTRQAVKFYNKSLRSGSNDPYLQATTYKNLATIYFDKAKYVTAGKYYDSTLTRLVKRDREYFSIEKKRENLVDVIKYEGIVQQHDSILKLVALSENDRRAYFDDYITKLKAADEAKRIAEEKQKEKENAIANNNGGMQDINPKEISGNPGKIQDRSSMPKGITPPDGRDGAFYFYTPTTVAYGRIEFQKRWGKRALKDNWRWSAQTNDVKDDNQQAPTDLISEKDTVETKRYTAEFYLSQLPTSQVVIDSLTRDRNFANYQLGVIYKEKFHEKELATGKFETLLKSNPEERLILPAMYNLYKLYSETNPAKAESIKTQIISNYPQTRYAQILSGAISEESTIVQTPAEVYKDVYKQFGQQEYVTALETIEKSLTQFAGDDLVPKFELLKASAIGKLRGVEAYKKAINYVALTYPNSAEGKQAEDILKINIPTLEKMALKQDSLSKNWKILYKAGKRDDAETKKLIEKLNKYIVEKQYEKFSISYDVYAENESFVVLHGVSSKEFSLYLIEALKDAKEYKIATPAQVISSENYAVVQVKKNYNQFLEIK